MSDVATTRIKGRAILRSTTELCLNHFPSIFSALVANICVAWVLSSIVLLNVLQYLQAPDEELLRLLVLTAVESVVAMLFQPGFIRMALNMVYRLGCSWSDLFMEFRSLPDYLFASLLYVFAVALASTLLIVPGILVAALFSLYGFIIIDEEAGPIKALKRSVALSKPYLAQIIPPQIALMVLLALTYYWSLAFTVLLPILAVPYLVYLAHIFDDATEREKADRGKDETAKQ